MAKQRLIDATALEQVFQNLVKSWNGTFSAGAYRDALERLQNAPTVSPRPLIIKCNMMLRPEDARRLAEQLAAQAATGALVLPPYCERLEAVPYDGKLQIVAEVKPCD